MWTYSKLMRISHLPVIPAGSEFLDDDGRIVRLATLEHFLQSRQAVVVLVNNGVTFPPHFPHER